MTVLAAIKILSYGIIASLVYAVISIREGGEE